MGNPLEAGIETLEAGGRAFAYRRLGGAPGRLPLVLLHGFAGDLNSFFLNQGALAASGRGIIALDLPGHGRSTKHLGEGGMSGLLAGFRDFAAALGLDRFHLLGHSMGGALATVFALQEPERVASLVLLAPGGFGEGIALDFIEGYLAAETPEAMKAALDHLVANPDLIGPPVVAEALRVKRLAGLRPALERLAAELFREGRQVGSLHQVAGDLAMPTLLVWGEADAVLPISQAKNLPPAIEVRRLPGVGHLPHIEAAADVNRLILEWLERQGA